MINLMFGDSRELIKTLDDCSVDSVITDSPYELNMMGRTWDNTGVAYDVNLWKECLRVLKPGGHLLSFSHSRTYHRIACAIEDAGSQIRDQIMWVYAQGMPKSGTLKPCHEPIVVARKPFKGSAKSLMELSGLGSYNIEQCRVPVTDPQDLEDFENNHRVTERIPLDRKDSSLGLFEGGWKQMVGEAHIPEGRYPGNIITDGSLGDDYRFFNTCPFSDEDYEIQERILFYKKATKKEKGADNTHISVKPVSLMQHLIRLVTPPKGTVLDIFMGSGSTGVAARLEGMSFIGMEMEQESFDIAEKRVNK